MNTDSAIRTVIEMIVIILLLRDIAMTGVSFSGAKIQKIIYMAEKNLLCPIKTLPFRFCDKTYGVVVCGDGE